MRRALALALGLLAGPAAAFDPAAMTEAERAAFGAAVRDYLLANPGLIHEMLAAAETARIAGAIAADQELLAAEAEALFAAPDDPILGNPEGDVTLALFTDYRCPFCRETDAAIAALTAADPGLRVVVKHYPVLAPDSAAAAAFALAVRDLGGDALHAEAHARLFGLRGGYTEASLVRLAGELGLDAVAVFARMESEAVVALIEANLRLGQRLGLDITPSFVLPGLMVRGQIPPDVLRRYIDAARAGARE